VLCFADQQQICEILLFPVHIGTLCNRRYRYRCAFGDSPTSYLIKKAGLPPYQTAHNENSLVRHVERLVHIRSNQGVVAFLVVSKPDRLSQLLKEFYLVWYQLSFLSPMDFAILLWPWNKVCAQVSSPMKEEIADEYCRKQA
jgi:hypothetical protein